MEKALHGVHRRKQDTLHQISCFSTNIKASDGVSRYVSRLETVSVPRRETSQDVLDLAQSRHLYVFLALSRVSMSLNVLHFMNVLTVARLCQVLLNDYSVSKHWHFLMKVGHQVHLPAIYSLTVKRLFSGFCCFMAILCLDNCTLAMSQPQTF